MEDMNAVGRARGGVGIVGNVPRRQSVAKAVAAAVWLGVAVLLITITVYRARRTSSMFVMTTSLTHAAELHFPAMLICTTYLPPDNKIMGQTSSAVYVHRPALVNALHSQLSDPKDGYAVCPRHVNFTNPALAVDTHVCASFDQQPVLRLDQANAQLCDTSAPWSYYFPVNVSDLNLASFVPQPEQAWAATRPSSNVFILYEVQNPGVFPLNMLLHTANTLVRAPTSFSEFARLFALNGGESVVSVPYDSFSRIRLRRLVTQPIDRQPDNTARFSEGDDCKYDDFDVSRSTQYSSTAEARLSVSYTSLVVRKECLEAVFDYLDVLATIGGVFALLATVTYVAHLALFRWLHQPDADHYRLLDVNA